MDSGKIDVNITFDENNQIRVLSADKYRETENLKGECIDFLKSKQNSIYLRMIEILMFCFVWCRNHVIQWNGYNFEWGAWAIGLENWRCQAEGHRCPKQNRGRRRYPKEEGAGAQDPHQREENDAGKIDVPVWEPVESGERAETHDWKVEQ